MKKKIISIVCTFCLYTLGFAAASRAGYVAIPDAPIESTAQQAALLQGDQYQSYYALIPDQPNEDDAKRIKDALDLFVQSGLIYDDISEKEKSFILHIYRKPSILLQLIPRALNENKPEKAALLERLYKITKAANEPICCLQ